jgi:glutamine amidotransferase
MIAIVDYGLGNLFSVKHALNAVGAQAEVTSSCDDVMKADAVVLPGVGAFGDAMDSLKKMGLTGALKDFVSTGRPVIGICLGMQLLMSESFEFGRHEGLGFISGKVVRFEDPKDGDDILKVPEVGWNRIKVLEGRGEQVYEGVKDGSYMYFVHSYYVVPEDAAVAMTVSRYGNMEFCSSVRNGNIIAFQFHPERSGKDGLAIYRNLMTIIYEKTKGKQG